MVKRMGQEKIEKQSSQRLKDGKIWQYLKVTISHIFNYCFFLDLALGLMESYVNVISIGTFRSEKFGEREAIEMR